MGKNISTSKTKENIISYESITSSTLPKKLNLFQKIKLLVHKKNKSDSFCNNLQNFKKLPIKRRDNLSIARKNSFSMHENRVSSETKRRDGKKLVIPSNLRIEATRSRKKRLSFFDNIGISPDNKSPLTKKNSLIDSKKFDINQTNSALLSFIGKKKLKKEDKPNFSKKMSHKESEEDKTEAYTNFKKIGAKISFKNNSNFFKSPLIKEGNVQNSGLASELVYNYGKYLLNNQKNKPYETYCVLDKKKAMKEMINVIKF